MNLSASRALARPAALGIVLLAATWFFGRGYADPTLVKSDEALYAAAALELSRGDNPLYPRGEFSHYRTLGKPPGALWPAALSLKIFGRGKAAVRLPTILAGIASTVLLALLASIIASSSLAGLLTGLLALTIGGWIELGRVIWLENTLTAVFLLALWLASRTRDESDPRTERILQVLLGLVVGYGAWVKHMVGFASLGAVVVAELTLDPTLLVSPRRLWRRFGVTIVVALAFFGLWMVPFTLDRGVGAALHQIPAKLAADPHVPRKVDDLWQTFLRFGEPWLVVVGSLCLLALLTLALVQPASLATDEVPPPSTRWQRTARLILGAPSAETRRFLLLACTALLASHLLVFGEIADKHRSWYMIPIFPLFALGPGIVLGRWLGRGERHLGLLGIPLVAAALCILHDDAKHLHWWFLVALAGLLCAQGLHRWLLQVLPAAELVRAHGLLMLAGRGLALGAVMWMLGAGLDRSARRVWAPQPPDTFAEYAAAWEKDPIPYLIVDRQRWNVPLYYQPSVYFYFSPIEVRPYDLDPPCDTSGLASGDMVLIHHSKYDCVAPRARQLRELSQWWRMVTLH
ncbi:MAG: glycosyltransferase family 39 protein [Pseudomonadota bacterium]